jgi:hypothetical protein
MVALLKKLVAILDGSPANTGRSQRGQSVVELAFITPVLIMLVAGTVEIGWFANNYLILLESSRVGARFGTIQEGDNTVLSWEIDPYRKAGVIFNQGRASDPTPTGYESQGQPAPLVRSCDNVRRSDTQVYRGFYNLIACTVVNSMDPLTLDNPTDPLQGDDDLVVSAFSLQMFTPSVVGATFPRELDNSTFRNQMRVVGRYPSNANECISPAGVSSEVRDPFDTDDDNLFDPWELTGWDNNPASATSYENQRGFTWHGHHEITGIPGCYGSEWTVEEIETAFNLTLLGALNDDQRSNIPSQGVVLVEIFWQHEMLVQFPLFNPAFNALQDACPGGRPAPGDPPCNRTIISVWAAFPIPSLEPAIRF